MMNDARGSYRSDVCRAAVLAREGGFYTDLDVATRFAWRQRFGLGGKMVKGNKCWGL